MKQIAIDFHNVTADLTDYWIHEAEKKWGFVFSKDDIKDWHVWNCVPISKAQFWSLIDELNNNHGNAGLKPVSGAPESIFHLSCYYPVHILTASRKEALPDIVTWTRQHGLREIGVSTTDGVANSGGAKFERDFDIYIDDNPRMVGATPKGKWLILFDQPWNRNVTVNGENEFRATSWDDVIRYVHGIQGVF